MSRAKDNSWEVAAAEERRRFLEMIHREVATPLKGIVAVTGLLARQPLTPDAQAYVRTIADSSESLLRRIGQTLELANGECGGLDVAPERTSLRAVMDDLQDAWQSRPSMGATLLVSYDGEPDLEVMVDAVRLKQLFDGLTTAALHQTARGAVEVSLKARAHGGMVHLEGRVRDSGSPMSIADIAAALDGVDRTDNRAVSLRLCRQLVLAMGGAVRAEPNPGQGVSIIFDLKAPRAEAEAAPQPEVSGGAAHVLVVDDNATNRMVAESLCEMFDCTSESAEDGVEAVEAAKTGRFDLILMDIKMPRMDGVEATKAIRALPGAAGRVPIIALTANADPEDARAYIASGMSSVVEKPIKPERLLAAMNAAFEAAPAPDKASRAA